MRRRQTDEENDEKNGDEGTQEFWSISIKGMNLENIEALAHYRCLQVF